MTPCMYRIDYVFERYFPQYWSERLCFRIHGWNHMVVGTKSGLLCYFTVNHYYGGTDADFNFFVHTGPKRKKAIMSDCVHIFLIGPQGSGKTTLASLLMRLMDADEGRVLIAGRDVRSFDKEELRSRFGVVFQNDTIFEDSIYENVRMGRPLDAEAVERALRYAQAEEFAREKERNEGAMLDIRGANLSGGQKQRVLIARALAAGPEILILDDSSSALDYRTDALLRRQLREHFRNTTTILIAQRISSVMHADHILVLEDGEMIGYGTHEELMKSCEVYREISRSQTGDMAC